MPMPMPMPNAIPKTLRDSSVLYRALYSINFGTVARGTLLEMRECCGAPSWAGLGFNCLWRSLKESPHFPRYICPPRDICSLSSTMWTKVPLVSLVGTQEVLSLFIPQPRLINKKHLSICSSAFREILYIQISMSSLVVVAGFVVAGATKLVRPPFPALFGPT